MGFIEITLSEDLIWNTLKHKESLLYVAVNC